jgi:hypothetical protein
MEGLQETSKRAGAKRIRTVSMSPRKWFTTRETAISSSRECAALTAAGPVASFGASRVDIARGDPRRSGERGRCVQKLLGWQTAQ